MRPTRLIAIAAVLVGIVVVPRVVGANLPEPAVEAATAPALLPTGSATPGAELDRLIDVFTERLVDHDDYLDVRTLGQLHLDRAQRDGGPADYTAAVRLLTDAHERDGDDPEASVPLASALLGIHRFSDAADLAAEVLAADAANLTAHSIAGDAALALGNTATASTEFAELAESLPADPSVAVRRSELAWQTGDVAASRRLAALAVSLAEDLDLGAGLAYYLTYEAHRALDSGDHATAMARLDRAEAASPDDPFVLTERGRLLAATGDLAGAEDAYRRSTDLRPDPATLQALGEVRLALGDTAAAGDAFATLEAVGLLDAAGPVYRSALARYHADHGDPAEAVRLAKAEAETRSDAATLHNLGRALAAAGRLDEARTALDEALATGVADPSLLFQSGVVWMELGNPAAARTDLNAALAVDGAFHPLEAPSAAALLQELP